MYIPSAYREDDLDSLYTLMQENNFATLITCDDGAPFATHLPFMLDRSKGEHGTLLAHMARANPQWRHFSNGCDVLVIFQGPHAYISPAWYASEFAVPTWNYLVVHAYGLPRLVEEQAVVQRILDALVIKHESPREHPWTFAWSERHTNLLKAIVAFDIEITRLEGKAKLSQNRSLNDQASVVGVLQESIYEADRLVAAKMAKNIRAVVEQPS